MTKELTLYPVMMPIKIIGRAGSRFEGEVFRIARAHFPEFKEELTKLRASSTGKYEALTITVEVKSLEHLDGFYKEIQTCKDVVFSL